MPTAKQIVVITGASAGLGRAIAHRFARDGARIALLARGGHKLAATVAEVIELGGDALAIAVDMADPEAVEAAAARVERELGPIDIWINNAAAAMFGRIVDVSPEELRRVSDVTYHGAVWGTNVAVARMRARGRGTIVQIGSGAAYRALPLLSSYSAAKHALRAFTDALRVELLRDGIDVHLTMVHPSAINTPFYTWARNLTPNEARPVPPVYQPQLVADIVHWAARARRPHVYVGWPTIGVIFADRLAPGLVDQLLARVVFDAQQGSEPAPPDQPDNLFEPVDEDLGVQGRFDSIAQSRAPLVKLAARLSGFGHRAVMGVGATIMLAGGALLRRTVRRDR